MPISRRNFAAAGLAPVLAGAAAPAAGRPIRLGGPIFLKTDDPREMAREHRRLGYAAAYCPNATVEDSARTKAIEAAFKAEDVVISEVGAWKNMLDPNSEEARKNTDYVASRLALADAVGARFLWDCISHATDFASCERLVRPEAPAKCEQAVDGHRARG